MFNAYPEQGRGIRYSTAVPSCLLSPESCLLPFSLFLAIRSELHTYHSISLAPAGLNTNRITCAFTLAVYRVAMQRFLGHALGLWSLLLGGQLTAFESQLMNHSAIISNQSECDFGVWQCRVNRELTERIFAGNPI